MTDQQILEKMGLTEDELRDLLRKFNEFVNRLNKAQRAAFLAGIRGKEESTAELDEDVTPRHLEEFMRKYAPHGGILVYNCTPFRPKPHE